MLLHNLWVASWVMTPMRPICAVNGRYLSLGDWGPLSHPPLSFGSSSCPFTQSMDSFAQSAGEGGLSVLE